MVSIVNTSYSPLDESYSGSSLLPQSYDATINMFGRFIQELLQLNRLYSQKVASRVGNLDKVSEPWGADMSDVDRYVTAATRDIVGVKTR